MLSGSVTLRMSFQLSETRGLFSQVEDNRVSFPGLSELEIMHRNYQHGARHVEGIQGKMEKG